MVYRGVRGCPHCGGPFDRVTTRSYSYERCQRCKGLWVSSDVVGAMAHAMVPGTRLSFTQVRRRTSRPCPDCGSPMQAAVLFHIPIDRCAEKKHGVFFDKDELAQVLERVGSEEPEPPAPPTSFASLLRDFFEQG
jgi:Zn-finger nucleic acid-binding protein